MRPHTSITLTALSGGNEHEFLRFVLKNAIVTSVLFGGGSVSSSRTEKLTIAADTKPAPTLHCTDKNPCRCF